ncbi:MAG: hypothetical protein RMK90_13205 [Acetobacteraceae bacterium]|nr:hypothetical protein [Acetobacteraceae bacterium]
MVRPDHGSGHDDAALLNAAHAVLQEDARAARAARAAREENEPPLPRPHTQGRGGLGRGACGEGTAPPDRIERASCSGRSFVTRRLQEHSGGSTGERTIWPFDGIGFLPQITVYASPDLFRKIGLAANQFAPQRVRQPLAALASRPRDRFGTNLIALSGKPLAQPERLAVVGDPGPIPA